MWIRLEQGSSNLNFEKYKSWLDRTKGYLLWRSPEKTIFPSSLLLRLRIINYGLFGKGNNGF
ncbi:MAG: hypothetical protein VKL42_21230 [Snowella sp.]|nr:hypothetical protein [Snowella sp.]